MSVGASQYVLVTPAKDEEKHIEATIQSVIAQTVLPARWVIVDDGSSDATAAIALRYGKLHPFITVLSVPGTKERSFARKVYAFDLGLQSLTRETYRFVGNLDADVTLPSDYYERILQEFKNSPTLGLAGGVVYTRIGRHIMTDDTAGDSVGGAIQLFRKECFEDIGGYLPLRLGGIDTAAEITARMHRWEVKKVKDIRVDEHRRTGSAAGGFIKAKYKEGQRQHSLGYDTAFYLVRSLYKAGHRPFIIGSATSLIGFAVARVLRYPIILPNHAVAFLRHEQRNKLRSGLLAMARRIYRSGGLSIGRMSNR
jgi:poly-beta-1,6-N-acetyl-D-glucosamine synthase